MNPGVSYYEDIVERILLTATDWSGGKDYALFRHKDSRHAFTEAYGRPQACTACWCEGPVEATFTLVRETPAEDRRQRFLLKFVGTWLDWRKFAHPVKITLNGVTLSNEALFLENTSTGWPGVYFPLPPEALRNGENRLQVESLSGAENTLLLAAVEILRQPDCVDFTVHSLPEVVRVGDKFRVTLHLLRPRTEICVSAGDAAEFVERDGDVFVFKALREGRNVPVRFESDGHLCTGEIDRIAPTAPEGKLPVWIGLDGDDLRHDTTGEMDRALAHFIHSGIGNYVGFRTALGRNFCDPQRPTGEEWKRWIALCRRYQVRMHYAGPVENLAGIDFATACGEHFAGYQFHEPYLVFQPLVAEVWATEALNHATNFQEKKDAYVAYLKGRISEEKRGPHAVWSGEPSLTCLYAVEAGVDGLLCEPVSNTSLLYGAARGSGRPFGAHIPGDWYFGYPHNEKTVRRLELALWLGYCYGGNALYIESSLFKTNAHDRNDWEDAYCRQVREILRRFYRFTTLDDRRGAPEVSLALIYGNLESLFWMDDDRIPETFDMGNWDRAHWGLPGETPHRRMWKASEAWLPRVPVDNYRTESLTKMFTGTPFGTVDVVPPTAPLTPYQVVAFLGWNTMTEAIYQNLIRFVRGGGILFLCGCHLDTRVDAQAAPSLLREGRLRDLLGLDISGPGPALSESTRSCQLTPFSAVPLEDHFWINPLGLGKVYFGNFFDYPTEFSLISRIQSLLASLAAENARSRPVRVSASSPFIHYTIWKQGDRRTLYALDAEWSRPPGGNPRTLSIQNGSTTQTLPLQPEELTVLSL